MFRTLPTYSGINYWVYSLVTAILLGFSFLNSAAARNSHTRHNVLVNHKERQLSSTSPVVGPLPEVSTSSSFDYWWPFSPALTSTTQRTSSPPASEETDSPNGNESVATTTSVVTATSSSPAFGLNSVSLDASASEDHHTNSSSLLATITALPPLTSPSLHPHVISAYHQPVNLLVFTPIFGILSSVIGLICGYYGYGYWRRRQQTGRETCLAGPKYVGVECEDVDEHENAREKDDQNDAERVYDETESNACREVRTVDTQPAVFQRTLLVSGSPNGSIRTGLGMEQNKDKMKANEGLSESLRSSKASTVFTSVASSDEDVENYDNARRSADRRGTVRHKSIHRRLAERLRAQFKPGYGFIRKKSKGRIKAREGTPELEEGVLLQDDSLMIDSPVSAAKGSLKRNKAGRSGPVRGHGRAISDFCVPIDGIRTPLRVYTLKDPGVTPANTNGSQAFQASSSPTKFRNNSAFDDMYTPLPARKVRQTHKLAPASTRWEKIIDNMDSPPKFHVPMNVDRRVLPTSPPLLNSPELESALFFSSSVDSARDLNITRSEMQYRSVHHTQHEKSLAVNSPGREGPLSPRWSRKLASKHSSANGSDPSMAHAHRLGKAPTPVALRRSTARASCLPTKGSYSLKQTRERSHTLPSAPVVSQDAGCTALDRVDAIVQRSWSARLLLDSAAPSSPTTFGTYIDRVSSNSNVGRTTKAGFMNGK